MKSKVKVFAAPRSIYTKDAIRIDWKNAIKEAEAFVKRTEDKKLPFKEHLRAYSLLCEIQRLYKADDISSYMDLKEKNKEVLY